MKRRGLECGVLPALRSISILIALLVGSLTTWANARADASVLAPATTGGAPAIDRALQRLAVHCRMLMIGAHPDDEDNTLMTHVAREGCDAAYLSLSRGEGGQNLIGNELGEALGVLRTGELLAARELEGGRQFFTRAYDFGYSKSVDETFEAWPKDVLAEDVLRVVRRFKPQIVLSIFPGDGRGRHGQHTVAGVLANELEQLGEEGGLSALLGEEGLDPWLPQAMYRRPWWSPGEGDFAIPLDGLDPASGRSILQVAAASRSLHRSQDMGRLQPLGDAASEVERVYGPTAGGASDKADDGLFDGVDTKLEAIADLLKSGVRSGPQKATLRERVRLELASVSDLAEAARAKLVYQEPWSARGALAEIVGRLDAAMTLVRESGDPMGAHVETLLDEKRKIAVDGFLAAAGVAIDATADRETLVAGESAEVALELWRAGGVAPSIRSVRLMVGEGLEVVEASEVGDCVPVDSEEVEDGVARWCGAVHVGRAAPATTPYYLRRDRVGSLYDWSDVRPTLRGEPSSAPPVIARFALELDGVPISLDREVVFRAVDQAFGEVRRPLRVVPELEVVLSPELVLLTGQSEDEIVAARTIEVELRSNRRAVISGRVELDLPDSWSIDGETSFEIAEGEARVVTLELRPPAAAAPGRYEIAARAVVGDAAFDASYPIVDYPHIRPTPRRVPARLLATVVDLDLPPLSRIGYVRGAADRIFESLVRVGLPVELLDDEDLAGGDLSRFEAIVIGSRAYEVEPALAANHPRILRYVEAGGLLIVQYQQYRFVRGGFSPLTLSIARPHGRVTDETAHVRTLEPHHPVFNVPNAIDAADWAGWVQERGLYFAEDWDPGLRPLLGIADPGEEEQRGALLVGRVGEGMYVYTGLSLFRQLPAGIPGAYRLFANLLALANDEAGDGMEGSR